MTEAQSIAPKEWRELVREYENSLNSQRTKDLQLFVRLDFILGSSLFGICLCRCMFGRKSASLSGNAASKAFLKLTEHPSHQPVELNLRTAQMSNMQKKGRYQEAMCRCEINYLLNLLFLGGHSGTAETCC